MTFKAKERNFIRGLRTLEDLDRLRRLGKKTRTQQGDDFYRMETYFEYTPDEIAPLFNFVEKALSGKAFK